MDSPNPEIVKVINIHNSIDNIRFIAAFITRLKLKQCASLTGQPYEAKGKDYKYDRPTAAMISSQKDTF